MNPHVVLIVLDTLRWDYSHHFDWLEELGFRKYMAWATAPWTLPSHISMFTGLYPSEHGVHEPGKYMNPELGWKILAFKAKFSMKKFNYGLIRKLKARDYRAVALTANPLITPKYGFQWDEYVLLGHPSIFWKDRLSKDDKKAIDELQKHRADLISALVYFLRRGELDRILRIASKYIGHKALPKLLHRFDKGATEAEKQLGAMKWRTPTFLFINLVEVHEPYGANGLRDPKAVAFSFLGLAREDDIERWRKLYPKYVKYLSKRLRRIVSLLPRNSLVIVTSDHGQMLGEKGLLGHSAGVIDDIMIKVPLWINKPLKLREPVSLADISAIIENVLKGKEVKQREAVAEAWGPVPSHLNLLGERAKELEFGYRRRSTTKA